MRTITMLLALGLLLSALAMDASAQTGTTNPTTISWDEPQVNVDGSTLADLAAYRVEQAPTTAGPWQTWGPTVAAANPNPPTGSRVSIPVASRPALPNVCTTGTPAVAGPCQYHARVLAIDQMGNVGPPSDSVPFSLRDSVAPGAASGGRADQ